MGIITVNQSDCLLWLGRYLERVYTTVRMYAKEYDHMIDEMQDSYEEYCRRMEIPNIYKDKADFIKRYPFDPSNPDSIRSNLTRAYDNAILLRGQLSSQCQAYIQLAMYDIDKAEQSDSPFIPIRDLMDHVLAFWGIVDDVVDAEEVRSILKTGKRIERIDMYARIHYEPKEVSHEIRRLAGRIPKTGLKYDTAKIDRLMELGRADELDYDAILHLVDEIGASL
ncbi:MAG: alpha-E domain-containing protein [Acidaminococcus sp.]|jgi:uncharacterized alpha-E superfamily protein|nr:alpha-E domain-containing protein [Acidaminococcus sp.]MCI2100192.1 alpha-E domain-containing protein [Acidaminococcus sp.]MCI2114511.1 alpha-E domain-containing protein [Acidaminococcus sp.]MCI2116485.1 alpha-E domain-containing protein [Acidaminococcus sp.]